LVESLGRELGMLTAPPRLEALRCRRGGYWQPEGSWSASATVGRARLDDLPIAAVTLNLAAQVVDANVLLADLYLLPRTRLLGMPAVAAMFDASNRLAFRRAFSFVARREASPFRYFGLHRRSDGTALPVTADWTYLRAENSEPVGICAVVREQVAKPEPYFTHEAAESALAEMVSPGSDLPNDPPSSIPPTDCIRTIEPLSRREREVLDLLLRGVELSGIGGTLHVSIHTIRNHTKAIYRKCGVHSRGELISEILRGHRLGTQPDETVDSRTGFG
jgi:DNA-binding CsgD family transcriptional regulator